MVYGPQQHRRSLTSMWWTLGLCLALVVVLVVVAKAIPDAQRPTMGPPSPAAGRDGDPPASGRSTRPTTPATGQAAASDRFTIAFAGDVHFEGRVADRLASPTTTFGPIAAALGRADLAMVNLETAITERGTAEPKEFTFRAPAAAFDALRGAGVDVVTMANNHGADFGSVGLTDSLAAIGASRFPTVGIGADADAAYAPWLTTVRGHRVAIFGASQIRDRTLSAWTAGAGRPGIASAYSDRLVTAVRAARSRAEAVVVYVHWGAEGEACPVAAQRQLVVRLIAAGADAVVGTHAHLLLGGGWFGKTYVAYGLGNFLWWRDNAYSNDTGVLTLTFTGRRVTGSRFTPARIDGTGVPVPAAGAQAARITGTWNQVRGCAGLLPRPGQ